MGDAGESENTTHQVKKLNLEELKQFRDRFDVPLSDKQLRDIPYFRPADDSAEMAYLRERRAAWVDLCRGVYWTIRRWKCHR